MVSNTTTHGTTKEKTSPFERKKTIIGSTTRLYGSIINPSTGEHVHTILKCTKIHQKIQDEQAAKEIIFALRDRCVRPQMHNPTREELVEALKALQVLWFLLPPIERHKGEKNKTFFLRTLHEVGRFRGVSMFPLEK